MKTEMDMGAFEDLVNGGWTAFIQLRQGDATVNMTSDTNFKSAEAAGEFLQHMCDIMGTKPNEQQRQVEGLPIPIRPINPNDIN